MENIVGISNFYQDPLSNMNYEATQMDYFNPNIGVPQKNYHLTSRELSEKDNNNMFPSTVRVAPFCATTLIFNDFIYEQPFNVSFEANIICLVKLASTCS